MHSACTLSHYGYEERQQCDPVFITGDTQITVDWVLGLFRFLEIPGLNLGPETSHREVLRGFVSVNPNSCGLRGESKHSFINSALYRVEWSASCPARFTPWKELPEPEIWYAAGARGRFASSRKVPQVRSWSLSFVFFLVCCLIMTISPKAA
jgi:hypothetical protein